VGYEDHWSTVSHRFLLSREYDLQEKAVLIWLASKYPDWDVVQAEAEAELGIGDHRARNILASLRRKGAITPSRRIRRPDGTWKTVHGHLAPRVRAEVRPEFPQVRSRDPNPRVDDGTWITAL
jgi:hypothetical protein